MPRAGTVHLGGTLEEIAAAEAEVAARRASGAAVRAPRAAEPVRPARAPAGKHTAWAYCHVPNGSTVDMTDAIEAQIERFAPGFRDRILARRTMRPAADWSAHNANYVGGDINGGVQDLRQLFTRPVARARPVHDPDRRASTSARRRPRRAAACTACAASTRPASALHTIK